MATKKLTSRHLAMMIDLVEGLKPKEVCEKYGFTDSRLSVLRSSQLWKDKESDLQELALKDSMLRINSLRGAAVDVMESCLDSLDEKIKLSSAKDILDRTGIKAGQELDISGGGDIHLYVPPTWNNPEQGGDTSDKA